MPRRYWLPIAVVVGLILSAGQWAVAKPGAHPQSTSDSAKPNGGSDQQNKSAAPTTPASSQQKPFTPVILQQACANPRDNDEANLCAQIRVANATEDQRDYAFSQNWIVGIEAFLLLVTVVLSAKATFAASKAARAANDAISADRAWVTTDGYNYGQCSDFILEGVDGIPKRCTEGLMLSVKWANTGRSPAIFCQLGATFKIAPFKTESVPQFEFNWEKPHTTGAVVGGGKGISSPSRSIADADYRAFMERKTKIFLYSVVRYFDVFDKHTARFTECTHECYYDGMDSTGGRPVPRVVFAIVGPQNTAR